MRTRVAGAALLAATATGAASCGGGGAKPVTADRVWACLADAEGMTVKSTPSGNWHGVSGLQGVVTATSPAGRAVVLVAASNDDADRVKAALSTAFNRFMVIRRSNAVIQVTGRLSHAQHDRLASCIPD